MDNVTNDVSLESNCSFLAYLCDCISFKITFYINECVCTGHGKYVEDREQFVGIGSLPLYFTMWIPGIKPRSSVLVTSTFQPPSLLAGAAYALYF